MAGEAAGESILFIAAVTAAAVVAGTLGAVSADFVNTLRDRSNLLESEFTGRIAIVNDPANVPNAPVVLYVKNTGAQQQQLLDFVILVDGTLRTGWTVTVDGAAAEIFDPGELAVFTLTGVILAPGDHLASVVSDTNFNDQMEFTV